MVHEFNSLCQYILSYNIHVVINYYTLAVNLIFILLLHTTFGNTEGRWRAGTPHHGARDRR